MRKSDPLMPVLHERKMTMKIQEGTMLVETCRNQIALLELQLAKTVDDVLARGAVPTESPRFILLKALLCRLTEVIESGVEIRQGRITPAPEWFMEVQELSSLLNHTPNTMDGQRRIFLEALERRLAGTSLRAVTNQFCNCGQPIHGQHCRGAFRDGIRRMRYTVKKYTPVAKALVAVWEKINPQLRQLATDWVM